MVDQPSTATTPHSNLDTKTRLKSILGGSAVILSNGTTGMYMPHLRSILLMHFSPKAVKLLNFSKLPQFLQ